MEASPLLPSPMPFPQGIFPERVEEALFMASEAFNVPLAVPSVTFLAVIGASIGMTRGLKVKAGWIAYPNLYWALVARSGMGKSPCSNAILRPIHEQEHTSFCTYKMEIQEYEYALKAWQVSANKAQRNGKDIPLKPERPVWEQIYVEDSTTQAVGQILADNPKGVLWYRDELSGLLADLGRYDGKGADTGDKARLLSAYDCGAWKVSRSTKDGLHIPHACVSIFGTVQPGLLPNLFKQRDAISGFLPRFLFVRCEQTKPSLWTDKGFEGDKAEALYAFIKQALSLSFDNGKPQLIEFSNPARESIIRWHDQHVKSHWYRPDLAMYEALAPKIRGAFFKLCLVLHCLYAWSENKSELIEVSKLVVEQTATLMSWLEEQQWQVWQMLSAPHGLVESTSLEKRVAQTILRLKEHIQNSGLPTMMIVSALNEGLAEDFHVSAKAVAQTFEKLGLKTKRTNKVRGVLLNPDILSALDKQFPVEKSVTSDINVILVDKNQQSQEVKNVTDAVTLSERTEKASLKLSPQNNQSIQKVTEASDGSDVYDAFLGDKTLQSENSPFHSSLEFNDMVIPCPSQPTQGDTASKTDLSLLGAGEGAELPSNPLLTPRGKNE